MNPRVDLAPVGDAFAALIAACPSRTATVVGAEQAFTDACETIERNASVLAWEAECQRKRLAERATRADAQAVELQKRSEARKALAERAANVRAGTKAK